MPSPARARSRSVAAGSAREARSNKPVQQPRQQQPAASPVAPSVLITTATQSLSRAIAIDAIYNAMRRRIWSHSSAACASHVGIVITTPARAGASGVSPLPRVSSDRGAPAIVCIEYQRSGEFALAQPPCPAQQCVPCSVCFGAGPITDAHTDTNTCVAMASPRGLLRASLAALCRA